jgi:hypothetical protein
LGLSSLTNCASRFVPLSCYSPGWTLGRSCRYL